MKTLPCFFTLFGVLVAFIGCQTSIPAPAAPKTAPVSAPKHLDSSIGSLYNDVQNGPLARYLRGETDEVLTSDAIDSVGARRQVEFICAPVGKFNLSPDGEVIYFKMRCNERHPTDTGINKVVEDIRAYREPGKHVFRIRFKGATVSVQDLGNGKREVRLHYLDAEGTFHAIDLPEQKGREHAYSFATLVPDTVEPISELRTLEIGSE